MRKTTESNEQILRRILGDDPLPQPDYSTAAGTAKRQQMEDFADFTRFVEGAGAWRPEFAQFIPEAKS